MRAFAKRYIGDGAYVECNGYSLIFTAGDGIRTTNTVVIDMNDIGALQQAIRYAIGATEGESDIERARR